MGNLRTNKDIGYQGFANEIEVEAVARAIPQFNPRLYDTTILNYGYAEMLQQYRSIVGRTFKTDGFEEATGSSFNYTGPTIQDGIGNGDIDISIQTTYNEILRDIHTSAWVTKEI